jgi:hypothetical protein
MSFGKLNPLAWASAGIRKGLDALDIDGSQTSQVPATTTGGNAAPDAPDSDTPIYANGEPVQGHFIENMPNTGASASRRTEQFARVVNSFDEDKQHLLATIVGKFFTALAYLAPLLLGWYAGAALGDTLTGGFTLAHAYNVFAHLISIMLELSIPMLGYAVAVSFRRAAKDRTQITLCSILAILFLLLAIGNAITQDVLLYHALPQSTADQQIAVLFRSFGPSIVDVLATIFISVVGVRNLKKYLADQREKIHAVREVNLVHIEMDKTTLQAELDRQSAIMDMQSKAQRAQTWNTIEAMQSEAMIDTVKRKMLDSGDGGSYRRTRY